MNLLLILWYLFCFFYGNRFTDYFLLRKPKTKRRTIFFLVLTLIFFLTGIIQLSYSSMKAERVLRENYIIK